MSDLDAIRALGTFLIASNFRIVCDHDWVQMITADVNIKHTREGTVVKLALVETKGNLPKIKSLLGQTTFLSVERWESTDDDSFEQVGGVMECTSIETNLSYGSNNVSTSVLTFEVPK